MIKFRIIKKERFIKPYEIEISIHKRKYQPYSKRFWTRNGAYSHLYDEFLEELADGAKIIDKVKEN